MDAAYWLINRLAFRIEGNPSKEIIVRIKPRFDDIPPEQAQILFDEKLVETFIATYKWRANSKVRLYFLHTALSLTPNEMNLWAEKESETLNLIDYQIFKEERQSITLGFDLHNNKLEVLLFELFSSVMRLSSIAHFSKFKLENAKLTFRAYPKNNSPISELKARVHQEFMEERTPLT